MHYKPNTPTTNGPRLYNHGQIQQTRASKMCTKSATRRIMRFGMVGGQYVSLQLLIWHWQWSTQTSSPLKPSKSICEIFRKMKLRVLPSFASFWNETITRMQQSTVGLTFGPNGLKNLQPSFAVVAGEREIPPVRSKSNPFPGPILLWINAVRSGTGPAMAVVSNDAHDLGIEKHELLFLLGGQWQFPMKLLLLATGGYGLKSRTQMQYAFVSGRAYPTNGYL